MSNTQPQLSRANLFDVSDCVAVITGGGTGLGLMMARGLAANGATVYILGRRLETLEKAAKQSEGNIVPVQCSVTSRDDIQKAVDVISEAKGYINLLVNNAGVATPNLEPHPRRPTAKWDIAKVRNFWFQKKFSDYATVFETNTTSALMVTMGFLELLDKGNKVREAKEQEEKATSGQKGGPSRYVRSQVLTLSSVGGLGRDNSAFAYGGSKAAAIHMMKNLATYLVPWKLRCNVIAPGYFNTEMTGSFYKATGGKLPATLAPEERFGEIEDIVGTVLFLSSKAGAYCNGLVLLVDGGYLSNKSSSY